MIIIFHLLGLGMKRGEDHMYGLGQIDPGLYICKYMYKKKKAYIYTYV
jgi:hypothetical protein